MLLLREEHVRTHMTQEDERLLRTVQSSTHDLLGNFRTKTESLMQCSKDIMLLVRQGYNPKVSFETAQEFFGDNKALFLAIDGTKNQDEQLDMLIFYAGAFGYVGQLEFTDSGCIFGEPRESKDTLNMSSAIPLYDADASNVVGKITEGGVEVDTERLPSALMHFAEYYMAVRTLLNSPNIKIILVDRMLSIDIPHLIGNAIEFLDSRSCILQDVETEFGKVSALDLELARMLHPNHVLGIPAPRSQLIKYAAINWLLNRVDDNNNGDAKIRYDVLLEKIGGKKGRLEKLVNDLTKFNEKYSLFEQNGGNIGIADDFVPSLKREVKRYWDRVFSASMKLGEHIFNTPDGKHPLIYQKEAGNETMAKQWITSDDLDYMTLIMIYALVRLAWQNNVLVIGLVKDIAAADMIKTVVPMLQAQQKIKLTRELPKFNSDKMLLQAASIINDEFIKAPWRTFEFDCCFKTIAPRITDNTSDKNQNKKVAGAFKNLISVERMFLKSYIQLWSSQTDPLVRSHVFCYDRPCYPNYDKPGELTLLHQDGKVEEEISPIIHFEKDSELSHLVTILH